jgi:hypothetical protein
MKTLELIQDRRLQIPMSVTRSADMSASNG